MLKGCCICLQHQDTAVQPIGNFRSDNAYMLPHELEAKARQRKQMQDALQQQIEEKRRKKEEETRREKEEER